MPPVPRRSCSAATPCSKRLKEAMADTTAQISKIQKTIEDDELTDDDRHNR